MSGPAEVKINKAELAMCSGFETGVYKDKLLVQPSLRAKPHQPLHCDLTGARSRK